MEKTIHTMTNLFAQLGLPNSNDEIAAFIKTHSPCPKPSNLPTRRGERHHRRAFCARNWPKMPTGPRSSISSTPHCGRSKQALCVR